MIVREELKYFLFLYTERRDILSAYLENMYFLYPFHVFGEYAKILSVHLEKI